MTSSVTPTLSLLEAVKTAVMVALRAGLTTDYPEPDRKVVQRISAHIQMEYPSEIELYPGIWVQFSFSEIRKAGITPIFLSTETMPDNQEVNKQYMMGSFKGRVTLSIVALSNLERDKIAGALINLYLFGKINPMANNFFEMLDSNDYVSISVEQDTLSPGGQSMSFVAPGEKEIPVYEDAYSFNMIGQFASRFETGELVRLSEIRIVPELVPNTEGWV